MNINLFEEISSLTRGYRRSKSSKGSFEKFKVEDISPLPPKSSETELSSDEKNWRGIFLILIVLIVVLVFAAKSFDLQVIKGQDNLTLAEGNRVRIVNERAERGLILDRNGEVLVRNKPAFSVELTADFCLLNGNCLSEVNEFLALVPLKADIERITKDLEAKKPNIVIASGLTKEDLLTVETHLQNFPNISVVTDPERDYLYSDAFAHLIGYVGFGDTLYPTVEGKAGVEQEYDAVLKGISGGEVVQVDSSGRRVAVLSEKNPIPGSEVELYVDKGLQLKAYELLKARVESKKATAGVVVAQDPKTGGILALVSYPAFDPNKLSTGLSQAEFNALVSNPGFPFFNRAISGSYPPGSTFKMIMAAAVLAEKIVDEYYQINDGGFIQVGSYIFRNWNTAGHGLVDLRRALQVSNDTYFYTVGGGYGGVKGLGIGKIAEWAKKFGFGSKTGIDLPNEVAGFMPDGTERDWYLGDTYIASIGQSDILSTPLQLNNVTTYYANGGFLFEPQVVKSIDGSQPDTEVISQNLIDSHIYDVVREGMKMSVEPGGTAYPLFDFAARHNGVELAGKTGTSEFGEVGNESTHAWFTVFGPYNGQAEIALTVFLEEGGGGSDDAAPIAKELLDYWFGGRSLD